MPDNHDIFDEFDWEELLRITSKPKPERKSEPEQSEPPKEEPQHGEEPAPHAEPEQKPEPESAQPEQSEGAAPSFDFMSLFTDSESVKPATPSEPEPVEESEPEPVEYQEPAEEPELPAEQTPEDTAPLDKSGPEKPREYEPPAHVPEPASEEDGGDDDEDEEDQYEAERDYMPIKPRRDGKVGLLGGMMYAVFVISLSVILACAAWLCASDVLALNKPEHTATVTLPRDIFTEREVEVYDDEGNVTGTETVDVADIDYVAEQLKDAGIIEYKFMFKLFAMISDAETKLDPGTYELSTAFDYRALVKKMTAGSPSQQTTKLTFPEGYTMEQIFSLLEENNICSAEDLYEEAANYKFSYSFLNEEMLGDASRLEGFLFPDTYEFYEGERAYSVINKFLYNFYTRFTAEMIEKTEERGLTIQQLITIASMIEREAADDEDRYNIASVIYNRLEQGMPLQVDATIQYILPERVAVLTEEELSIDSPYNTYLNTGLPPTPIANPGLASIRAALDPADTGYLYYALDTSTGTHRFFNTYAEQQAFVATQDYEAYYAS